MILIVQHSEFDSDLMKPKFFLIFVFLLISSASATASDAQPAIGATDGRTDKRWYEFVFFSPLVSGLVVTGFIGFLIQISLEKARNRNAISTEKEKKRLESFHEYQDEATTLLAPIFETYDRLSKLRDDAPRIEDNKILVEYLSYVLEPYSRFRVGYSESFKVYTRRFCPSVVQAFDYISDDVCNAIIFLSSDPETRRSDHRMNTVCETVNRLRVNIEYIESNISNFGKFAEPSSE